MQPSRIKKSEICQKQDYINGCKLIMYMWNWLDLVSTVFFSCVTNSNHWCSEGSRNPSSPYHSFFVRRGTIEPYSIQISFVTTSVPPSSLGDLSTVVILIRVIIIVPSWKGFIPVVIQRVPSCTRSIIGAYYKWVVWSGAPQAESTISRPRGCWKEIFQANVKFVRPHICNSLDLL